MAQAVTDRPVKMTLPGPMTIMDSIADELAIALAQTLNFEVKKLAEAGCRWIQVDEPVFARYPESARAFGIENLELCFHGVNREVTRCTHICCGYPDKVDSTDYVKAPPSAYSLLAPALDEAAIEAVLHSLIVAWEC